MVISILAFVLLHLTAGDAASILLQKDGIKPTAEALAIKRAKLGLDKPLYSQYLSWLNDVLHLDFGESYRTGKPVIQEIMVAFPETLKLTLFSFGFLILIAWPCSILSAIFPNSLVDHISRVISFISVSVPSFWIGL